MPRKRKTPIRLFAADGRFTEQGELLHDRLQAVVEAFIKEMPEVDLNDVMSISARAGNLPACREIVMRRKR